MSYILFARWFGLISIILSLGILFNLEDAKRMAKNLIGQESGYIIGGVQPIIFGSYSLVVLDHPFSFSWQLVLTIISLLMVLAGIFRVLFVTQWKKILHRHIDSIPPLFSLFGLLFGLLLLYIGFISDVVHYNLALADL
jgi:hypothetical protein